METTLTRSHAVPYGCHRCYQCDEGIIVTLEHGDEPDVMIEVEKDCPVCEGRGFVENDFEYENNDNE